MTTLFFIQWHYFLFSGTIVYSAATLFYSAATIFYSVAPRGHSKTNSVGVLPLFGFTETCICHILRSCILAENQRKGVNHEIQIEYV